MLPEEGRASRPPQAVAEPLDGDDIDTLSNFALYLIREGRFTEAELACRALREVFPDQIDGLDRLALLRAAQGRRAEAATLNRAAAAFAETHDGFDPEAIARFRERLGMLCDGGYAIGVEWVEAPDDLPEATYLSRFGFRTGWQLGVLQSGRVESLILLSDDPSLDPTDLSLSASCGAE